MKFPILSLLGRKSTKMKFSTNDVCPHLTNGNLKFDIWNPEILVS